MSERVISHWKKFFYIILVGFAIMVVTNLARAVFGDTDQFQITREGLNVAIMLFALGAACIGVFSSNSDRSIFGRYVIYIGLICAIFIFFAYEKNFIALVGFISLVISSSLIVTKVRVPYP